MDKEFCQVVVEVEKDDILGASSNSWHCPIANAINRLLKKQYRAAVGHTFATIVAYGSFDIAPERIYLPSLARKFIHNFDWCNEVETIQFTVAIPKQVLKRDSFWNRIKDWFK